MSIFKRKKKVVVLFKSGNVMKFKVDWIKVKSTGDNDLTSLEWHNMTEAESLYFRLDQIEAIYCLN